ncbi:hypothetical protein [Demequina iriomotensis]|uniref:hypothetical protein n=1 Tax=Demequina iriomotensis TaxID=1536641 RepID=UPI0007807E04|nr:hypothetical protein [Demequina iriomotensis]
MDALLAVQERARRDVAALDPVDVPSIRDLRDVRLASLVRRAGRIVRHEMREEGALRPWWERSPLLILAVPLALAWGGLFADVMVLFLGGVLLVWALVSEPRLNRGERREFHRLMRAYRNAAADALDARADRRQWEWGEGYGLSM